MEPDEFGVLAPLPQWLLFAELATQTEVLDAVCAPVPPPAVAEPAFDPQSVVTAAPPEVAGLWATPAGSPDAGAVEKQQNVGQDHQATPHASGPGPHAKTPLSPTAQLSEPVLPKLRPVELALVSLAVPVRRSIFLRPLPTLADVEGAEPKTISPMGTERRSLGHALR